MHVYFCLYYILMSYYIVKRLELVIEQALYKLNK